MFVINPTLSLYGAVFETTLSLIWKVLLVSRAWRSVSISLIVFYVAINCCTVIDLSALRIRI